MNSEFKKEKKYWLKIDRENKIYQSNKKKIKQDFVQLKGFLDLFYFDFSWNNIYHFGNQN